MAPNDSLPSFPPHQSLDSKRNAVGLRNLGNTGWMNTALQCMGGVQELSLYFLKGRYKSELNRDNPLGNYGEIGEAYATLLSSLYASNTRSAFAPREFKNTLLRYAPHFSVGREQHDAQEFLGFLLDALHEDLNRITKKPYIEMPQLDDDLLVDDSSAIQDLAEKCKKRHRARNDSIIMDLFDGSFKCRLMCPVCEKVSIRFDPFCFLSMELPIEDTWCLDEELNAKAREERDATLEDCFELFGKKTILDELDLWYCPRCVDHVRALRTFEIWTAPEILIIHLLRFQRTFGVVNMMIEFPLQGLDVSKWVSLKEDRQLVYDAFAVVNHNGGSDGNGHYSAFVQNFSDEKWCEYDDSSVAECDASAVMTAGAYVLFYRRRDLASLSPQYTRDIIAESTNLHTNT